MAEGRHIEKSKKYSINGLIRPNLAYSKLVIKQQI